MRRDGVDDVVALTGSMHQWRCNNTTSSCGNAQERRWISRPCASFGTLPEQFEQMIVENQRSEHSLRESTRALTGVMPQHESSTVKQREGRLQRLSTMQHGIGVCRTISTLACREHCQNPCLHPRTNLAFLRLFVVELKHCGDGSFIRALPHNAGERRGTIKERAATS